MLLRILVVVDAHEKDVARVFRYLRGIFLAPDLVNGSVGRMVELQLASSSSSSLGIAGASSTLLSLVRQFDDEGRLGDVTTGNHHEVGIPLARGILAVDDILVPRPYICHSEHARQRVLVVVGENTRVLVVCLVDAFCHGLLVA